MSNTVKQTPLDWEIGLTTFENWYIRDISGNKIAQHIQDEKTALLICKSVNSHRRLIEALEEMLTVLRNANITFTPKLKIEFTRSQQLLAELKD